MIKKIAINNHKLKEISSVAESLNIPVYLVGGSVRDSLIGRRNIDLDIVVEGDPSSLVKKLAKKWKASVLGHERFMTFVVTLGNGHHIDFARARKEIYDFPAALPKVKNSDLKSDLRRRDFTINALAVSLNRDSFGEIIDLCGGHKDLLKNELKVLHSKSFRDDPTRILRLARFASRGFKISRATENFVKRYKYVISKLSDERISKEILEILKEDKPSKAFECLQKWDLFENIFPGAIYSKVKSGIDKPKNLEGKFKLLVLGMNRLQRKAFMIKFKLEKKLKKNIEKSMGNEVKCVLNGNDLIHMGYKPGPLFKRIFDTLNSKQFSSRRKASEFVFDNFPQKI